MPPTGRPIPKRKRLNVGRCAALALALAVSGLRAAPEEGDAPGLLDGLLGQYKIALSPEQREGIARDALERGRWLSVSRRLAEGLLGDTKSGYVDQLPWISRLRLAQAFAWLGTPEGDDGRALVEAQFRQDRPGAAPDEVARAVAALDGPEAPRQLASLFGDEANFPRPGIVAARIKPETLVALLRDGALIDCLGETATLDDYQPGVWRVLADLQERNPQGVADFPALAVACAVVHDRAFPADWPHRQVPRAAVPMAWGGWGPLFDSLVAAQREGTLLADLSRLRADQLRFLVDFPLVPSEMAWAREHVRASRSEFDKAFFSIRYDKVRLRDEVFDWPEKDYRLATISSAGGICVDQAYFAAMAGKAQGLPTLFFEGEGDFGGHAWFGYLKEDDAWFLDAGRYAGQNYVTGIARDPQTWRKINDHQLAFLSHPGAVLTPYHYSRNLLALSMLPGVRENPDRRQALLDAALQVDPHLPETWEAVAAVLRQEGKTEDLCRLYRVMAEQFSGQEDLRVEAIRAQADIEEEAGRDGNAQALWSQVLLSRPDLAVAGAKDLVFRLLDRNKFSDAAAQYESFVAAFAKRMRKEKIARGILFYGLVSPYAEALDRQGRYEAAVAAVKLGADRFHLTDGEKLLESDVNDLLDTIEADRRRKEGGAAPGDEPPAP